MKVTLRTISEISGYSITTVSRALAGYDDVNEQTRQRIIDIANDLGYVPNQIARRLQAQQSHTLGLVLPVTDEFSDPFFIELLSGIGLQASKRGYDLLLSAQVPGDEELKSYRRMVSGSRVDGMVVARVQLDDPRIHYLQNAQHPFVVYGHTEAADYPYIDVDGYTSFKWLAEHFIDYGHTRIAIILPPPYFAFTQARFDGYRAALAAHGLPLRQEYVLVGDLTQRSGAACAEQLLDLDEPPTAIIGCTDLMALGVMNAIRRRGLQPGDDIAVAGYDDIPPAREADPPLTTVRQPIRDIGQQLVDMLLTLIDGQALEQAQVLIEPELVIRHSSGQPLPSSA